MSFQADEPPQTVEWYTPPSIFKMLGCGFTLDPCHPGRDVVDWVPALSVYTKADDGLVKPWVGRVWLNPPYGRELPPWLKKMHEHRDGIALVFARTDTAWFHDYVAKADAVLFLKKRVRFVNADGVLGDSPNCGSMLVAWGDINVEVLRHVEHGGHGVLWRVSQ
jgi:hypothetical protein